MLVYIDVAEDGTINACGSTPVNDSEIFVEVDNEEDSWNLMKNIHRFRYIDGELVEKSQGEIDDIENAPQPPTELEELRSKVSQQETVIEELMFIIIPEMLLLKGPKGGGGEI